MQPEPLETAVRREVHERALRLVTPAGTVPGDRVQNIRERRVAVFGTLFRLALDCVRHGVRYEDARAFAMTGVWIVDKAYGR